MKYRLILFAIVAITQSAMAQKKTPVINHIALYVVDLQKSATFYRDIIGLDTIPEPFRDGKHAWFSMSKHSHVHVISGAKAATVHDKNNHLCFSVPSMDEFIARLKKSNIQFENWAGDKGAIQTRVDGIKQIWFKDPDGYWIEINNDYH